MIFFFLFFQCKMTVRQRRHHVSAAHPWTRCSRIEPDAVLKALHIPRLNSFQPPPPPKPHCLRAGMTHTHTCENNIYNISYIVVVVVVNIIIIADLADVCARGWFPWRTRRVPSQQIVGNHHHRYRVRTTTHTTPGWADGG